MSDKQVAKLLMSNFVTHDVKRFVVTKPEGFSFQPGQGVELAINQPDWIEESRPFTPTGHVEDEVLEFTIKGYPKRDGVTKKLHQLEPGTELLLSEPFGTIKYDGPGVFLAGGAGITPFIAILRNQAKQGSIEQSSLFFSNKSPADVIYEKELRHYLQSRCTLTCTEQGAPGYLEQKFDEQFLAEKIDNYDQPFYVCGPPGFMDAITGALKSLGANPESLIFEE